MKVPQGHFLKSAVPAALLALALGGAPVYAAEDYPAQQISAQQRCPVCGMYPARYQAWAVQVIFKDHGMTAVESPAELFRFLKDVKKYDSKHAAADIARIYATDYAKRGWIDARQAFYVEGSKVKGPMGADLPAFATKAAAEGFAQKSGGHVMTFDELQPAGANGHPEHGSHEGARH